MDRIQDISVVNCDQVCIGGTQIINQATVGLSGTKENTIDFSKTWIESERYELIHVPALNEITKNLQKFNLAVVIGIQGEGKTTLARKAIKLGIEDSLDGGKTFLKLATPQAWQSCVNANEEALILIDDLFGSSGFDKQMFQAWKPILNDIITVVKNTKVQLIVTIRKDILAEAIEKIDVKDRELFDPKYIVDISGEFKLNHEIKRNFILKHQSSMLNFGNCGSGVKDGGEHLQTAIDPEFDILLSDLDNIVGFPSLCHIYFSDKENVSNTEKFKDKLNETVLKSVEFLRENQPLKYLVLALIFFSETSKGKFGLELEQIGLHDMMSEVAKVVGISTNIPTSLKKHALYMRGVYVQQDSGVVRFVHEHMCQIMFLSLNMSCQQLLVKHCNLKYLLEHAKFPGSTRVHSSPAVLQPKMANKLFQRLHREIDMDPNLLNAKLAKDNIFVNSLFEYLSQKGLLLEFLSKSFDVSKLENYASLSNLIMFPTRIPIQFFAVNNLQFLKNSVQNGNHLSQKDVRIALKLAIMKGNLDVVKFMISEGISLDGQSLMLGACNPSMISFLLQQRNWPIQQLRDTLLLACYIGREELAAQLIKSHKGLLFCLFQINKTLKSIHIHREVSNILDNMNCRFCSSMLFACMTDKVHLLQKCLSSDSYTDDRCIYCRQNSQRQNISLVSYLVLSRHWKQEQRQSIVQKAHIYGMFDVIEQFCAKITPLCQNNLKECATQIRNHRDLTKCLLLKEEWKTYQAARAIIIGCAFGNLNTVKCLLKNGIVIGEGFLWLCASGFSKDTKLLEYLLQSHSWSKEQLSRIFKSTNEFKLFESGNCVSKYL